jgi:hypothetical protein
MVNLPWEGAAGFRAYIRACNWHCLWLVTTSRHVEGRRERPQDGTGGSTNPRATLFAPVFIQVTARWVPRRVWGCLRCFYPVISWLWALGSVCLLLIGRECASLDWWGVMDTWAPVWQHVATWPGVGLTGPTWCLVNISLIQALRYANDISVSIVLTSPLQWCRPISH